MVVSSIIPDASMPVIDIGGKKVHAEVVMNPYVNVAHVLWENDIKCWKTMSRDQHSMVYPMGSTTKDITKII